MTNQNQFRFGIELGFDECDFEKCFFFQWIQFVIGRTAESTSNGRRIDAGVSDDFCRLMKVTDCVDVRLLVEFVEKESVDEWTIKVENSWIPRHDDNIYCRRIAAFLSDETERQPNVHN